MKLKYSLFTLAILITITLTSCKKKYAEISLTGTTRSYNNGENVDFSVTKQSSESENKQDFIIESTGTKSLTVSSINIEGANAERFTLVKRTESSLVIEKSKAESFTVSLKTDLEGTFNATLLLKSDSKDNSSYTINLIGTVQ